MEETAMEEQQQQNQNVVVPGKSKLRYPLRSAAKKKEEKPTAELPNNSSATRRVRPASTVSKSVGVLDLSDKDKSSAKPPRRLSIPAKSISPASRPRGSITPISETRRKKSANAQGKSETPLSTVSRTTATTRKKFDPLALASHWLTQIKLSENVSRHSVSLGLFKLALEAKCEPLQRMRNELKAYVRRHDLSEMGGSVKELFESYGISDNPEQLQVSETCSQVPEEGTRSSDDEVHSSTSTVETRKLRPRSLNAESGQSTAAESAKKETIQKNNSATRTRGNLKKSTVSSRSVSDTESQKIHKKLQRPSKLDNNKEKAKIKQQGKKSTTEKGLDSPVSGSDAVGAENKENMDAPLTEGEGQIEVM